MGICNYGELFNGNNDLDMHMETSRDLLQRIMLIGNKTASWTMDFLSIVLGKYTYHKENKQQQSTKL